MRRLTTAMLGALACLCPTQDALSCTSAIISGRLTADGRPIIWKNQDTNELMNVVLFHKGEKYDYIGNQVAGKNPRAVWAGTNSAGFAIFNTLSYNQTDAMGSRNGLIMADALGKCATVEDFKHYLDTLPRPMYANSNYGVMDAKGGAAYFETTNVTYHMYDVNDPAVAPDGYLVRTNFSVSGTYGQGAGYMRYNTTDTEVYNGGISKCVTPLWVMEALSHSFANPFLGVNLRDGRHNKPAGTGWSLDADFIARMSTSSATVIQGVRPGESAEFTTMWIAVGYPPASPLMPVWVKGAERKLPAMLRGRDSNVWISPLCKAAHEVRKKVWSYQFKDRAALYFNWELLFNNEGTGYMQHTERMEQEMCQAVAPMIEAMRASGSLPVKEAYAIYDKCDAIVAEGYKERMGIDIPLPAQKSRAPKGKKK